MSDRDLFDRLRTLGIVAWSAIGLLVLTGLMVWILVQIRVILLPLVLAIGIVYLTNPLVGGLARIKVPRLLGAFVAYIVLAGLITLVGFLIVPIVSDQVTSFVAQLPDITDDLTKRVLEVAANVGISIDLPTVESIQEWLSDPTNREQIIDGLRSLSEAGLALFEIVLVFLLAPIIAIYLLIDLPGMMERFKGLVPSRSRDEVVFVSSQLGTALGGFVRGQLVVALFVGVASSFGLWLIGHDFWLVIGMTAGILNLVPFIGPIFGGALAAVTALVVHDLGIAVLSIVVFVVVQQIDNHLISPLILRVAVKLHPVTIILALIAGGAVGGFFGVLLAVPVVAGVKIIVGHVWRTRVLGESWEEASEALLEEYEPSGAIAGRIRRAGDTGEQDPVRNQKLPFEKEKDPSDHAGEG